VTPIPVIGLLFLVGLLELVGLLVIIVQVDPPRLVLMVVPVVIVLMIAVIDSDLNAVVARYGRGHNDHGCSKHCGQK
jgi:diacylglycerol kinase